jgi:hypothetical protein
MPVVCLKLSIKPNAIPKHDDALACLRDGVDRSASRGDWSDYLT